MLKVATEPAPKKRCGDGGSNVPMAIAVII
jgi:hypothetical protein